MPAAIELNPLRADNSSAKRDFQRKCRQLEKEEAAMEESLKARSGVGVLTSPLEEEDDDGAEPEDLLEQPEEEQDFPPRPANACRALCWDIVTHPSFDHIIMGVILLNVAGIVVAILYPDGLAGTMAEISEFIFGGIYVAEAALKITAFGWLEYWGSNWNKFDFTLVVMSVFEMVMAMVTDDDGVLPLPPTMARALRTLRVIMRIARVVMRLMRLWHLAQKTAAARNIGIARPTKIITEKATVTLAKGDEDCLLDCGEGAGICVEDSYLDQWCEAKIQRKVVPGGRICVYLALPGAREPITAAEMGSLFTWKSDDVDEEILSFRACVLQPRSCQTPVKLEVLKEKQVGTVFVYYENGTLQMEQWCAKQVDADDPNDGVAMKKEGLLNR